MTASTAPLILLHITPPFRAKFVILAQNQYIIQHILSQSQGIWIFIRLLFFCESRFSKAPIYVTICHSNYIILKERLIKAIKPQGVLMPDITRGERTVQLFAQVISNPEKKFTISDLMASLNIPENERRNVQRDMRFLSEIDGGRYIRVDGDNRSYFYSSALNSADRLLFPNFENTMLHYIFLQRIANMYPATGEIISSLLERIQKTLPQSERKTLEQLATSLNPRIIFMGTQPSFEEDSSEKIKTILRAILEHRKIDVTYITDYGEKSSLRIPLMVVIYQNEIYIGCESASNPGDTYVLKFRRIKQVKLTNETFVENPKILEKLRKRVISGAAILGKQEPNAEEVLIRFHKQAKFFLEEKPFHRSMKINEEPDGSLLISMKVEVNELLFRWVLSYADCATVIKPFSLRQKLHDFGNFLFSTYPTYGKNFHNVD